MGPDQCGLLSGGYREVAASVLPRPQHPDRPGRLLPAQQVSEPDCGMGGDEEG